MQTLEKIHVALGLAHPKPVEGTPWVPGPIPILETPKRYPFDADALRERRVVLPEDPTPAGHAFRMLRTRIRQLLREHSHRVVGIVSAAAGEGKTLVALNLALALAADPEQAVVLLELDLKRPTLAEVLGIRPEPGLDAYINGTAALTETYAALEGMERLLILPLAGPVTSSVALRGPRVTELLRNLRETQLEQVTIVDLPPVLLSDDVLAIAPALDGVIIVGCEGVTRREDLERLREMLGPVPVLGCVLNRASESEKRSY